MVGPASNARPGLPRWKAFGEERCAKWSEIGALRQRGESRGNHVRVHPFEHGSGCAVARWDEREGVDVRASGSPVLVNLVDGLAAE